MKLFLPASAVLLMLAPAAAPAALLSFNFTARIDQPGPAQGTLFTGSFGYDTDLLPTSTATFDTGRFAEFTAPSIFLSTMIGGHLYKATGGQAGVTNTSGSDGNHFGVYAEGADFALQIGFDDPSAKAFNDLTLPRAFPLLAQGPFPDPNDDDDLPVPSGTLSIIPAVPGTFLDATVLSVSATAVPEPLTWSFLIAGFGIVGASARQRRIRTLRISV